MGILALGVGCPTPHLNWKSRIFDPRNFAGRPKTIAKTCEFFSSTLPCFLKTSKKGGRNSNLSSNFSGGFKFLCQN